MQVTDKFIKPITEMKYLNAENTVRYRSIMRIFYENYEKLRYWLYQEDIYEEMIKDSYFSEYRIEQCQQDLTVLTEWKNLNTLQDTRNVATLEEFKNKKYRYQMSEYSVEIERFIIHLENLHIEGSSLEPNLLERLRQKIGQIEEIAEKDERDVHTWWTDLNTDFIRLNQNYQDYIRDLNSVKAEEMMQTREFLIFKDRLVEYLRSFIQSLQQNVGIIEEYLRLVDKNTIEKILNKVIVHEMSIPVMDDQRTEEMVASMIRGRYENIYNWFISEEGRENEAVNLFDVTNDVIRKITRYAAQLSEKNAMGANRREEYHKVAEIFLNCNSLEEAHCMSAMVFGLERPCHLEGELIRETDSMNMSVYQEEPMVLSLKPRIRNYHEKISRSGIREFSEMKLEARRKIMEQQKEELKRIHLLEQEGKIDFACLPVISSREREILLKWLSDALESSDFSARTDEGRRYILDRSQSNEKCVVHCEDGIFTMPRMAFVFQEEEL